MIVWRERGDFERAMPVGTAASHRARRRGDSSPDQSDIPAWLLAPSVRIAASETLQARPSRREGGPSVLDFTISGTLDVRHVTLVRHASRALTIHAGDSRVSARRGARDVATETHFRITVPTVSGGERRGAVSSAIKVVVLEVTGAISDYVLPKLAAAWETRSWKKRGLVEGWHHVSAASLRARKLAPITMPLAAPASGRALLFLHGTFSDAAGAFAPLADTDFFARVASLYGDRIYAFNHFSVSKTPQNNARDLLAAMGKSALQFDVVTHSRGGLVLREIAERRHGLGEGGTGFDLGRAILVASPNDGTPLATPKRWEDTVGLLANILEVFPENPLTLGGEFVAEGIVWIAHRAAGGLPGIGAMDANGDTIVDLQEDAGPRPAGYSALVANYAPDASLARRWLDAGVDLFFGGANDLVVPTEGGWRLEHSVPGSIPSERIGCFGFSGNLKSDSDVCHVTFFREPRAATFIAAALAGEALGLSPIDVTRPLPAGRLLRAGMASDARELTTTRALSAEREPLPDAAPRSVTERAKTISASSYSMTKLSSAYSDAFQLLLTKPPGHREGEPLQLIAAYGGARVILDFETRNKDGGSGNGTRFNRIIAIHDDIRAFIDGKPGTDGKPRAAPSDATLNEFGRFLFEVLFPPRVLRLYDVARARERTGHLNVILTSEISWIADKAWEFAYDPNRKTFLATEDLHFVRNVVTDNPADQILPRRGPLRILVAVAQPLDKVALSADEEEGLIRRGFAPLVDSGRVQIDVLLRATPAKLHGWISTGDWDVVHFIGHGEFENGQGYLLFEDEGGGAHRIDDRTAREIFCHRGVRLVFLNACETGRGGKADFNKGIATALVAGGLPSVVANQFKVLDRSATAFAQHFYWALALGMTLGAAARESRVAVNYSIAGESIDWAVPVVYARDPEGRLCEPQPGDARTAITPSVVRETRRPVTPHSRKIAVWDLTRSLPDVEKTLAIINAAQSRFGFELRELTVPIGAWQAHDKEVWLRADEMATKLAGKNRELGVEYIFGITDLPLAFEQQGELHTDYYNWWGEENDSIGFISTSFREYPSAGDAGDRYVANCIVAGLAGKLADHGSHGHPPVDCPFYLNYDRSFALASAPMRFDPQCRRDLAKVIPDDLPALEAILHAFGGPAPEDYPIATGSKNFGGRRSDIGHPALKTKLIGKRRKQSGSEDRQGTTRSTRRRSKQRAKQ